jgi:phenylacetate-CoA ligase
MRGDRIANLFYAGDLYGSFLLHVLSIMNLPAAQNPIAGHVSVKNMIHDIIEFSSTAILGTVSTMCQIAEQLQQTDNCIPTIRLLLFPGEAMYSDQLEILNFAFPNATPRSFIYDTIESGVIGLPTENVNQRVHKANSLSFIWRSR